MTMKKGVNDMAVKYATVVPEASEREEVNQALEFPTHLRCDDGRTFTVLAWRPHVEIDAPISAEIVCVVNIPKIVNG